MRMDAAGEFALKANHEFLDGNYTAHQYAEAGAHLDAIACFSGSCPEGLCDVLVVCEGFRDKFQPVMLVPGTNYIYLSLYPPKGWTVPVQNLKGSSRRTSARASVESIQLFNEKGLPVDLSDALDLEGLGNAVNNLDHGDAENF